MANAKISDDSVFIPETTDIRLIDGLAGYKGSNNAKITGDFLVESVINSNGSGTPSTATVGRITFYGVGGDSLGGSSSLTWNQTTDTLAIGTPGGAAGLNADLELSGNYIAGSDQPEINFKFGETTNSPKTFKITTQSDGADQTWLLPEDLPTSGQVLEANAISTNDVTLSWVTPSSGGGVSPFTVLTGGSTVAWDPQTNPNAFLSLAAGFTNILTISGDYTTIDDGTSGYIILDPTNSTDYKLPDSIYGSGSGISSFLPGGLFALGGIEPVRLDYVYRKDVSGATGKFYFVLNTSMTNSISYPAVVQFNTTNLLAYYDPANFNPPAGWVNPGDPVNSGNFISNILTSTTYFPTGTWTDFSDGNGTAYYPTDNSGAYQVQSFFQNGTDPAEVGSSNAAGLTDCGIELNRNTTLTNGFQPGLNITHWFSTPSTNLPSGAGQSIFGMIAEWYDNPYEFGLFMINIDQWPNVLNNKLAVLKQGSYSSTDFTSNTGVISESDFYTDFYPEFKNYASSGGDDILNNWTFVSFTLVGETSSGAADGKIIIYLGCKGSYDWSQNNPGNLNWAPGDGNTYTLVAGSDGLVKYEELNVDIDDNGNSDVVTAMIGNSYWSANVSSGLCHSKFAIYGQTPTEAQVIGNWAATRDDYINKPIV